MSVRKINQQGQQQMFDGEVIEPACMCVCVCRCCGLKGSAEVCGWCNVPTQICCSQF